MSRVFSKLVRVHQWLSSTQPWKVPNRERVLALQCQVDEYIEKKDLVYHCTFSKTQISMVNLVQLRYELLDFPLFSFDLASCPPNLMKILVEKRFDRNEVVLEAASTYLEGHRNIRPSVLML